jgi:hypothetical protein
MINRVVVLHPSAIALRHSDVLSDAHPSAYSDPLLLDVSMQTADKVTLEVFSLPPDRDLAGAAVAAAVVPGAGAGQQDSRLELPPAESIQQQEAELEGLVRGQ